MRGEREEGAQLVGREQPVGHGAAAALALLRQRRGALLQARHHVRRHARRRRAAARRARRALRLQMLMCVIHSFIRHVSTNAECHVTADANRSALRHNI